jgi:CheY-like chemotaxis protein
METSKEIYRTYFRYTAYPPSILMVTDNSACLPKLQGQLENYGCQVYCTDPGSDSLARVGQKYFDLIVLALEQPDVDGSKVCQKLKTRPELAGIPLVVLMPVSCTGAAANSLDMNSVYYLPQNAFTGRMLLQIIEQIYYMIYRYLALL